VSFAAVETGSVKPGAKTPRGTIVPSFYEPHRNLNHNVTLNGVPIGFKISDVAPERRWAIGVDGDVIDQGTFERYYEKILSVGSVGPIDSCHIPAVDDYVSKCVDPDNETRFRRLVRIDKRGKRAPVVNDGPIVDPSFARKAGLTLATTVQASPEMLTQDARDALADAPVAETTEADAPASRSRRITCPDCGDGFMREKGLSMHMKRWCKKKGD